MNQPTNDRELTVKVLDRQASQSRDKDERETLEKAAKILRSRINATRGPADAGGPVDEIKTR